MAGVINKNPLVFTAADTTGTDDTLEVTSFVHSGVGVGADRCVITDKDGHPLWSSASSLGNGFAAIAFAEPLRIRGIRVTNLPSGTLYVYLRDA